MTDLESNIVDNIFKDNLQKFYIRCIDDTPALIKESDIDTVLDKLNSFDSSLQSTVDKFDDGLVHCLDIKTVNNETIIYYNDTYTL